jgi:hypothetical protein
MNITFTLAFPEHKDVIEPPKPASAFVPDWYKQITPWISGKKEPHPDTGSANQTIKKCMPVFDMITAGYIITTPCDVWVKQENGAPFMQWTNYGIISFHPIVQTQGHPATKNGLDSPKWMNPWAIKTPKGWSCLFVTPAHRDLPFTLLPGIVDTDGYTAPVNFPFVLNDPKFEGLIPAGTPMVQVIPIKRDSWKLTIGEQKDYNEAQGIARKMGTVFFDRYRRFWWNRKEYK